MSAIWEYRELRFSREAKRSEVKAILTSMAEIDRWEIDRIRISRDGRRWISLRRKTFWVQRTA